MIDYVVKNGKQLKKGYTTGSCATGAAKAATIMALTKKAVENITINLPIGETLTLNVVECSFNSDFAICAIVKDGGDDPDVTNGMKIYAKVRLIDSGIKIFGGVGIGKVTKAGLPCAVGSSAINPVPMKMIRNAVQEVLEGKNCGAEVEIFAPEGEEIAKNTFNSRLGILGGISILGTTGIVEPMSENALIDTIKTEINMISKEKILFIAPGNYGVDFAFEKLNINVDRAVKCSNFIGETLDYAVYKGFKRILLIGHVGKLVKIAAGVMNTHSKIADGRNEVFAAHAAMVGLSQKTICAIMVAITTDHIHNLIDNRVYESICKKIDFHLQYRLKGKAEIEFLIFSKENGVLMESGNAKKYIDEVREYEG
ncbi:MAG: cobalt-precorrin-5B (C(1))-methyltransferase CbiD [Anaerotignaceae bacterium]